MPPKPVPKGPCPGGAPGRPIAAPGHIGNLVKCPNGMIVRNDQPRAKK